jgi:biopolymer transport protein ExbD
MKLRAGNRTEPEINLTSLIDVVLLLLVFFMITTSFVKESELAIHLPESSGEFPATTEERELEITVMASGRYLVNGRALVDSRPMTLKSALRQLMPEVTGKRVTITADAQASHQAVVTAMDVSGQLGFVEISIATLTPADQAE